MRHAGAPDLIDEGTRIRIRGTKLIQERGTRPIRWKGRKLGCWSPTQPKGAMQGEIKKADDEEPERKKMGSQMI